MKPPTQILCSFLILLSVLPTVADPITNPIQTFAKFHGLSPGRTVYKWAVDLNNDGTREVLLDVRLTPQEIKEDEKEDGWDPQVKNERDFDVYIPNSNGSGYFESKGTDFGTYFQIGTSLNLDIMHCYVGRITQLNRRGVVTVDHEPAGRKNSASNTVVAYTLEGDHLKVTHLAQYDPDKGGNAIYDQYLSDKNRTSIKLEEITVK